MQNIHETSSIKSVALERLSWARKHTERILAGVPEDALSHRAGGRGNHALWVMGHLAWADDDFLATVTGCKRESSDRNTGLFAAGSEPSDQASDYPTRQALLTSMQLHRRRLMTWVESLDAESIFAPTPQAFHPFAPDAIRTVFGIVGHDLLHAGQVATVRASLGLAKLVS